jgi:trimethylamine:corrinoid methyltransferase-like protein
MGEGSSRNRRRGGRKSPPSGNTPANAFLQDRVFGERPRLGFLGPDRLDFLKEHAISLLADYGALVAHPKGREALLKAGAREGTEAGRIRLPRALIAEALRETPKEAFLAGRDAQYDMALPRPDGGFVMRTGTGGHGYVDPRDASYRNMDLTAAREIAAVTNDLGQVGFIAHPFVHGVPEVTADIHAYAAISANTRKHGWIQPYQKENVEYLLKIAAIVAGGEDALRARPSSSMITCSFSPLEFKFMDTEAIIQAGQYGMPLHACSLPSAGGTAPLSVPALVVMAAAEILGMVTMAHVLAPGTPVIATPLMFTLDMRTGSALQSCVESQQAANMAVQLMKEGFGLLTHSYGAGSDTPDADHQSMAERAMLMQNVALAGADILGGVGQLECATVYSPVQAVLDDEIGRMVRRFLRTPEISETALNWKEMRRIRAGGHFLDSAHTIARCRDQLVPEVFRRDGRDEYEANARRGALEEARDKALAAIEKAPEGGMLSEEQNREIAALITHADAHIVGVYSGKVEAI